MGWIPNKLNWKEFYKPRTEKEVELKQEITLQETKKYPDFYYNYRYRKHKWKGFSGLNNIGLNYRILLQAIK